MSKYIVCDGTLVAARTLDLKLVPNVLACSQPWTIKEETPLIPVDTESIVNIIFVVSLFIAFCAGFHKGGQR